MVMAIVMITIIIVGIVAKCHNIVIVRVVATCCRMLWSSMSQKW
jgi:uncharacterized membrane protein